MVLKLRRIIMNKINILGIGPGSRDYILNITEKKIKEADVLIGGQRALDLFADFNKKTLKITANLSKIRDYIKDNCRKEKIAVLVSGDPGLYSFLAYLKKYFPREDLEVIPGISAMQLAFARATMVWQDAKILSLHGKDNTEYLLKMLKKYEKVGFFTDYKFPPVEIAQYLLKNNIKGRRAIIFEDLSYPEEKIIDKSLEELSEVETGNLTVMVIYNENLEF